ncbi:MAG: transporter, partial [Gammaproteobacteria bacterium]
VQGHVIYAFPRNVWAAIGITYFAGGRTTIDGISNDDLQQNWRSGITLALPINRHHSIKIFGNSGISTRTGTDYDSLGVAWQYRWGQGF